MSARIVNIGYEMGTIAIDIVFCKKMTKLQHISLTTTLLMLSLNTIGVNDANALAISSKQKITNSSRAIAQYQLAQATSEDSGSEDEMIDALEKRQKKIESLKELKLLNDISQNEDTLDKLQEQNFNVESLEELEAVQSVLNNPDLSQEEMLDALQAQNLNIESLPQL